MSITNITKVLASLGFESETCLIYEALWEKGPQTISELSRNSGIERTKVYRLLPQLTEAQLIEIDKEYAHDIIHIASAEHLQEALTKQKAALDTAQRALPELITERAISELDASRVNVYRGTSGIKQLLWNETKAKGEVLSVLQEPIQSKTNSAFFERWVAKCNERDLKLRGVVGDAFYTSRDEWYKTHVNERLKNWNGRHIDDAAFSIEQNMVIYDDVVAYFVWNPKEIFGVEIHNPAIAKAQRQFFELLWRAAE